MAQTNVQDRTANLQDATHPRLRAALEGQEKFCAKCDEWWPADVEFFFADPGGVGGLFYCCKACYREKLDPRRPKRTEKSQ